MLADNFSGAVSTEGEIVLDLAEKNVEVVDEFLSQDKNSSWEVKCIVTWDVTNDSYSLVAEAAYQVSPPPDLSYGYLKIRSSSSNGPSTWHHCGFTQHRGSCSECGAKRLSGETMMNFMNGTDSMKFAEAMLIAGDIDHAQLDVRLFHIKKASAMTTQPGNNASLPSLLEISLKTGFGADVEFLVGAEKVRAHSHLLAAASEVFAKTFEHDANYKATRSLKIEDANPLPFKEMIRCVYTDSLPKCPDDAFLVELLLLSDRFRLEPLVKRCQLIYIDSMSVDNVSSRLRCMKETPSLPLVEATLAYFMKRPAPDSWTAAISGKHPGLAQLLSRGSPRSRAQGHQTRVRYMLVNPESSDAAA